MHIASHGLVRRSLYAAFSGYEFAAYWQIWGEALIIARKSDGATLLLQGDEARTVEAEIDAACTHAELKGMDECEGVDRVLSEYSLLGWDEFGQSLCAPSSDMLLLNFYR